VRNKTPYLTGFSARLCGSAKASAQARTRAECRRIAANSIADTARMFAPALDARFMHELDTSARRQSYDQTTTFWAWAGQILGGNTSCSQAVGQVQAWCAEAGKPVPASNTAAYCTARGRLRGDFLAAVQRKLCDAMETRQRDGDRWHGMSLKAMDGSSARLMDTPANQKAYPQPSGQKPGCGFPVMGFVGVVNLSSGAWLGAADGKWSEHDSSLAGEVLHHFGEGDLALADRAFNSYELVCLLLARGTHSLMRLHQARHRNLQADWQRGEKLGPSERLVTWKKPAQAPAGSRLSSEQWDALPATLEVRYLRFRYENREGKKSEMVLVTTLTDAAEIDWTELAELYATRWEIELKLRDLKTTLGMERFEVKSPAMARKTLRLMMIAHNLVRSMMQRAAIASDHPLRALSFKGSLDLLVAWRARHRGRHHHGRMAATMDAELLDLIATKKVVARPFRREPRAVKRRPKSYPYLTAPRREYVEIPHRSRYRKPAQI
jgi:hypothetical protein